MSLVRSRVSALFVFQINIIPKTNPTISSVLPTPLHHPTEWRCPYWDHCYNSPRHWHWRRRLQYPDIFDQGVLQLCSTCIRYQPVSFIHSNTSFIHCTLQWNEIFLHPLWRNLISLYRYSGEITTLSRLDYEHQKSYSLVVEAHDNGGRRGVTSVEVRKYFLAFNDRI